MKYIIAIIAVLFLASCAYRDLSGGNYNGHWRHHRQWDCPKKP